MKEVQSIKTFHRQPITCLKYSLDGTKIVTASCDNTLKILDVRTMNVVQTLSDPDLIISQAISKFSISPNGKFVVIGGHSGTLFIFNVETGELEEAFDEEHNISVLGADWAPGTASTIATMDKSGLLYLWK